jgi:signal transduction histidine kinase
MVDDSIRYTRSLTYGLSSPLLREAGLVAAVEWLLDEHRKCHDMRFEIHDDGLAKPLDESMAAVLYQAVRELLVNVVRHANARLAVVTIERRQSEIRVSVQDDGVGIRVENMDRPIGFGLYSIRERLEFMGGSVEIDSAPGRGTRVDLVAPLGAEPR